MSSIDMLLIEYGALAFDRKATEALEKGREAHAVVDGLLAACEAALPIVESQVEYQDDPCEKVALGIRAAIAKARGA